MGITYNAGTNIITVTGNYTNNLLSAISVADAAGGWGVFFNPTPNQYYTTVKAIQIGDSSTSTPTSDRACQLTFYTNETGTLATKFNVKNNASLTLGTLQSATYKTTTYPVSLFVVRQNGGGHGVLFDTESTSATINLYGTQIFYIVPYWGRLDVKIKNGNVYNVTCFEGGTDIIIQFQNCISNFFNVLGTKTQLFRACAGSTFNSCRITGQYTYPAIFEELTSTSTYTNLYIRDVSRLVYASSLSGTITFLDADTDNWIIQWVNTCSGSIQRKYTFNLQVIDNAASVTAEAIVPLEGADVTLYDINGSEVFNETTDENGYISTQIVSRGYFDQAHSTSNISQESDMQDYSPHFLVVTASGYEDYMDEIVFDIRKDFQISMNLPAVPAGLASATPADVATGETFFGASGTQETGTLTLPTAVPYDLTQPPPRIVEENKADKVLLLVAGMEITKKRILKHKLNRLRLENERLRSNPNCP